MEDISNSVTCRFYPSWKVSETALEGMIMFRVDNGTHIYVTQKSRKSRKVPSAQAALIYKIIENDV